MPLTLSAIPGYTDLADAALVAGQAARGIHLTAISSNATFGMVNTEVFIANYVNGDTVPLPISPHDGYNYSREELLYVWGIRATTSQTSGWISSSGGGGSLFLCLYFVDQSTGVVTIEEWYRSSDSHSSTTTSNDGQLIVFTIGQRQRHGIIIATSPSFSSLSSGDMATDKPWKQSLAQGLNGNAKFGVVNHEVFYLGEYYNGQTVTMPISPLDGYHYAAAECRFAFSWRWTPAGNTATLVQPPISYGQMAQMTASINTSGVVSASVTYVDLSGNLLTGTVGGRIAAFAFCHRSGAPGSMSLANLFAEVDPSLIQAGHGLRASSVLQIKENADAAVLTPEFFGPTTYADGSTITLPVSPVDGYTYVRSECYYIYEWSDTTNQTGTHLREPLFWSIVDQATGGVQLQAWRLPPGGPYVDDNNTLCRIKVITVARRAAFASGAVNGGVVNAPTDTTTTPVAGNPYAIAYDMGGGRTTLPLTGESLLTHVISSNLTSVTLPTSLIGSAAGCRRTATTGYVVTIKRNGSAIGSINYGAGSTVGVFSFGGDIVLIPGDVIEFIGGIQDLTCLGLYWTIVGSRV